MGTWDFGPFDNDDAADFSGRLTAAPAAERPAILRAALAAVVDEPGYLEIDLATTAIAAAAIVAARLPGALPLSTPYAPDDVNDADWIGPVTDLVPPARTVLDRVAGDDSEWRELWQDGGALDEALAALAPCREILAG